MAISDNYIPIRQLGNGVTTQFSASWNMIATDYARVYLESVSTGVQTLVSEGPGAGQFQFVSIASSGFTIQFNTAPTSANYVIVGRSVDLTQTDPYRTSTGYQGAVLEASLDKLTAMIQDLNDQSDRALKFPLGSTLVGILPGSLIDGAVLYWDGILGQVNNGPTIGDIADAAANAAIAVAAAAQAVAAAASSLYIWCGNAGGTANAIQLTPAIPFTSVPSGTRLRFRATADTTLAAVTIEVVGVAGTSALVLSNGGVLNATLPYAAIKSGDTVDIQFNDSGYWQLKNAFPFGETISAVVAAGTLDLSATGGDFVTVSGNTGITAVTLGRGQKRVVRFTGTPTITNSGSLVLPAGANLTIVAGDILTFRNINGVVYAEDYQPVGGYVDNINNQTIGGEKTFSQALAGNGGITARASGRPMIVDSTSSAIRKLEWQDNGTKRGSLGADSTFMFSAMNSVDTQVMGMRNAANSSLEVAAGIYLGNQAIAAATTLDWYEEGTWTPVLAGSTIAGTAAYSVQQGNYVRRGNNVKCSIYLAYTGHTGTGQALITLPFTSGEYFNAGFPYAPNYATGLANSYGVWISTPGNPNIVAFAQVIQTNATAAMAVDAASEIILTFEYKL